MKWFRAGVGVIIVLLLAGYFVYKSLPQFVASLIQEQLANKGIESHVRVYDVSIRSLKIDLNILSPFEARINSINVFWDLSSGYKNIPISINIEERTKNIQYETFSLFLESIDLNFVYEDGNIYFESLKAKLDLVSPIKFSLTIHSLNELKQGILYSVVFPKQGFKLAKSQQLFYLHDELLAEGELGWKDEEYGGSFLTKSNLKGREYITGQNLDFDLNQSHIDFSFNKNTHLISVDLEKTDFFIKVLGFNVEGNIKAISENFPENIQADVVLNTNLGKASLRQIQEKFGIDYLEKPQGKLSSSIKVKKALTQTKIYSDNLLKIESAVLYGMPIKNLHLETSADCFFEDQLKCVPRNGIHSLKVQEVGDGFPIDNLNIHANVQYPKFVSSLKSSWLGAKIQSQTLEGDWLQDQFFNGHLLCSQLNLSKVMAISGLKNLQANGDLFGDLKFQYSKSEGLRIQPSIFESKGPGIIRYKDVMVQNVPEKIQTLKEFNGLLGMGQQALVYKALDNFHYTKMSLNMERLTRGGLKFRFHLLGSNPDLANGQLFDINIPIEGSLEGLLLETSFKSLAESQSSEEYIRRLRKRLNK